MLHHQGHGPLVKDARFWYHSHGKTPCRDETIKTLFLQLCLRVSHLSSPLKHCLLVRNYFRLSLSRLKQKEMPIHRNYNKVEEVWVASPRFPPPDVPFPIILSRLLPCSVPQEASNNSQACLARK